MTNLATALEQPELYTSQAVEQQVFRVLRQGLGQDNAMDELTRSLITHLASEGVSVPPRVFMQLLAEVTSKLRSCSLMAVDFHLLGVMEFYASLPLLATLLTKLPEGKVVKVWV